MKRRILVLAITGACMAGMAHAQERPADAKRVSYHAGNPGDIEQGQPTNDVVTKRKELNVMTVSGRTYNSEQISRMPFTNVNSVANTVPGVYSVSGGTPSIRGANPSGTAYFVDGVRVYGAIPNAK